MLFPCQKRRSTEHQQLVHLIHWLNYLLFMAAVISVVLMLEIRRSPTPWGWGFILVAIMSMLSATAARLSSFDNTALFFIHLFLLFSSLAGQGASFLVLFAHTDLNLQYLSSHKSIPCSRTLLKSDAVLFICMFCIQLGVLMLACAAYNCNFDNDYVDLEASKKNKVQQEATENAESSEKDATEEMKRKKDATEEMKEKMDDKYGQWTAGGGQLATKK